MDKNELKNVLKEQASSFPSQIQNKMIYLQGETFLSEGFYQYDLSMSKENDLLEAFMNVQDNESKPLRNVNPKPETMHVLSKSSTYPALQVDKNRTKIDFQKRRKNLTARIAALRGTSLPGEYLPKK